MTTAGASPFLIVSNVSDDPFGIEIGYLCGQAEEVADVISLRVYSNTEFCPRFIGDPADMGHIGRRLDGVTVVICSGASRDGRDALAMRTLILARAARENGAASVVLVEPDLFYSAQDRGPHAFPGEEPRSSADFKKFDGQPFTARLYAELLKAAGVDAVITVHNHSRNVRRVFEQTFGPAGFENLDPAALYADYLAASTFVTPGPDGEQLVLCAPDAGAREFADGVHAALARIGLSRVRRIVMQKERSGERQVAVSVAPESESALDDLAGRNVVVLDDMIRTGSTIIECCRLLRRGRPRRVCVGVTHFLATAEAREVLSAREVDEILALDTIQSVLNRDSQGRLRRKMVVLKIERWIAAHLLRRLGAAARAESLGRDLYAEDMSSKNPRWTPAPRG